MKARLLKKILNNTGYAVSNHREYIAVGSPLCHDLISVNKETLKLKYALDTWREGRKSLEGKSNEEGENELLFIWDKLAELIASGEIQNIINGKDEIENPLPVFSVEDGKIVESITDEYGWPNTDDNGICMYENTHFPAKEQAIKYGLSEYKAGLSMILDNVKEKEKELSKAKERVEKYRSYLAHLESLQGIC
jgi:hypothetical protein